MPPLLFWAVDQRVVVDQTVRSEYQLNVRITTRSRPRFKGAMDHVGIVPTVPVPAAKEPWFPCTSVFVPKPCGLSRCMEGLHAVVLKPT